MKRKLLNQLQEYSLFLLLGVVLFIGVNAAVFYAWKLYSATNANPLAQPPVRANLSDIDNAGLDLLLEETWDYGWKYEPWVAFAEIPRNGRYVKIYEGGFRRTIGSSNNLNSAKDMIFFFGGSTTFGYNVADEHTIPTYVQEQLPNYDVFNFGRAYYFSKQENILLLDLIEQGIRPNTAIFLDGLNERCDGYRYEGTLAQLFSLAQNSRGENSLQWIVTALSQLPVIKAFSTLSQKWGNVEPKPDRLDCRQMTLEELTESRLMIREAICNTFGIKCLTFLQPFAGMHGVHQDFELLGEVERKVLGEKYRRLKSLQSADWIDVSGSLKGIGHHAYVDNVHYSPKANEEIAKAIAEVVLGE